MAIFLWYSLVLYENVNLCAGLDAGLLQQLLRFGDALAIGQVAHS